MVNGWGENSEQECLLARLRAFLPPKVETLEGYLGVGHPLFGDAGGKWRSVLGMGFLLS